MTPTANPHRETRAFYDKISQVYDLLAQRSEGPVKADAANRLQARPGERILEIGCGTGRVLDRLVDCVGPSGAVIGLDLSMGMLAIARGALDKTSPQAPASLVCADAIQLPARDSSFDAIFMSFTLELFEDGELTAVLAECLRVPKSGGRISIAAITQHGPHGVGFEIYEWTHRHFPELVDCRPIDLAGVLTATGFRIIDRSFTDMWVPVEIVVAQPAA